MIKHAITISVMDLRLCATLPVFHAFIECDAVSSFGGKGKRTSWNTWQSFPEATDAFEELLLMQGDISDHTMAVLEQFVLL